MAPRPPAMTEPAQAPAYPTRGQDVGTGRGSRHQAGRPWESYRRDGAKVDRDRLILHYSPLVKYVAGRVSVGFPTMSSRPTWSATGSSGSLTPSTSSTRPATSSSRPMPSPDQGRHHRRVAARSTGCPVRCGPRVGPSSGRTPSSRPASCAARTTGRSARNWASRAGPPGALQADLLRRPGRPGRCPVERQRERGRFPDPPGTPSPIGARPGRRLRARGDAGDPGDDDRPAGRAGDGWC